MKLLLKILGLFFVLFAFIVFHQSLKHKKTYEVVAGYKKDFSITFVDFANNYNELVAGNKELSIGSKPIKSYKYDNGIIETQCTLTDTLDINVYWDNKTKRIKEISISGIMINDKAKINYGAVASTVINVINNNSLQLLSRLLIAPSQCLQSLEQCA